MTPFADESRQRVFSLLFTRCCREDWNSFFMHRVAEGRLPVRLYMGIGENVPLP